MQTKNRKTVAYPARASVMKSRKISSRRRGYKWIDIVCQSLVIGGVIGTMMGMVIYANHRDNEYFKSHSVASFPSRPEECMPDCEPMDS
jgi:hypothetical protein